MRACVAASGTHPADRDEAIRPSSAYQHPLTARAMGTMGAMGAFVREDRCTQSILLCALSPLSPLCQLSPLTNIPPIHRPAVEELLRRHHPVLLEHHTILHHELHVAQRVDA